MPPEDTPAIHCPDCNGTAFEKRGERRTYHPLDAALQDDSWSEGDVTIDTDDGGEDVIYCVGCDSEFTEKELRAN